MTEGKIRLIYHIEAVADFSIRPDPDGSASFTVTTNSCRYRITFSGDETTLRYKGGERTAQVPPDQVAQWLAQLERGHHVETLAEILVALDPEADVEAILGADRG